MSIASEINDLRDNIDSAFDSVEAKGGTIPANKNLTTLLSSIGSIDSVNSITPVYYAVSNTDVSTLWTSMTDTWLKSEHKFKKGDILVLMGDNAKSGSPSSNPSVTIVGQAISDKTLLANYSVARYQTGLYCWVYRINSDYTFTSGSTTVSVTGNTYGAIMFVLGAR